MFRAAPFIVVSPLYVKELRADLAALNQAGEIAVPWPAPQAGDDIDRVEREGVAEGI